MTLDLEESRTSPEYPAGHGRRRSEDSGSLKIAGKCAVQYCPRPTESHAHTRSWVWVHLQGNGILTVSRVVLPQIPHLYHSGWDEQSWKNEWWYKSVFRQGNISYWLAACWKKWSPTHQQLQTRWGCADPETKPLWRSAGYPARKTKHSKVSLPSWAQQCFHEKSVSCWRYSQHWEPYHECCSASSSLWWRGWSLPCCEHRWSVSPVCRNHLGGRHECDKMQTFISV